MEDMSNLCKGLTGGNSMSAGNTISDPKGNNTTGAPGSSSEQVAVTLATPNAVVGNPDLDTPPVKERTTLVHKGGDK